LALAGLDSSIPCPEMKLLGRWGEALATGSGNIHLDKLGDFHFELNGKATNPKKLKQFIAGHQTNPYDGLGRFRLVAVNATGQELHCGFVTKSTVKFNNDTSLQCLGVAEGLSFDAPAIGKIGTEILILLPERHWISHGLSAIFRPLKPSGISKHTIEVLGSCVEFSHDPASNSLAISVECSEEFPQTYTEGWLSEPLRMMLGQLVFPRVIVRSNPDQAIIMVPQIRQWHAEADGFALLDPASIYDDQTHFFKLYGDLLTFVATARDGEGNRNFERHDLTLFYEELAQAMRGSRWIMTLTLASAVEGVLSQIFPIGTRDETANLDELRDLKNYIEKWEGHLASSPESIANLKDRAKSSVSFAAELTAIKRLRLLANEKKVRREDVAAWDEVRNKVAHGNIFSRFSSAENDRIILNLMSLYRDVAALVTLGRTP
jgi:hypothetical protein